MEETLIVICGPTASGKTKLGIELAKRFDGEIVSADSMQIYKGMDIGTAKPSMEEREGIVHHMIDVASPEENYSVARYVEEATLVIEDIFRRGKRPILVGGTGLYIESLCKGREFAGAETDGKIRAKIEARGEEEGMEVLLEELRKIDPETGEKLHLKDKKRIFRALEVYEETGKTLSFHNAQSKLKKPRFQRLMIGLNYEDREDLRQRIYARVDEMVALGLEEEVQKLLSSGIPQNATAMQAIGYKEFSAYVAGEGTLESAIEELKLRSRQYAKRQLTWFRHIEGIHWIIWDKNPDFSLALQNSISFLLENGLH